MTTRDRSRATGRRQPLQRAAGEPVGRPLVHALGPEAFVELDRRRVPVEHGPIDPAAAALDREARQRHEQRLAEPAAAELRADEKVFEVDAWLAEERRVV